jgi:hypothetical protein
MKFGNKNNAERNITQMSVNHTYVKKKIATGMGEVAGEHSWFSTVANVHLTKHIVALVYMHVCVSIQLVSHMPNIHPADNR